MNKSPVPLHEKRSGAGLLSFKWLSGDALGHWLRLASRR